MMAKNHGVIGYFFATPIFAVTYPLIMRMSGYAHQAGEGETPAMRGPSWQWHPRSFWPAWQDAGELQNDIRQLGFMA